MLIAFGTLFLVVVERVNMLTGRDESMQFPLVDLVAGMPIADFFVIIITQTMVGKLEEPESLATRQEIERFDQSVCGVLRPTEFADFVDPDARAMRQQEALKVAA